jgi:hypothetical protein
MLVRTVCLTLATCSPSLRRAAMIASSKQTPLPNELHVTPETDTKDLIDMIRRVRTEDEERHAYDSGEVAKQLSR